MLNKDDVKAEDLNEKDENLSENISDDCCEDNIIKEDNSTSSENEEVMDLLEENKKLVDENEKVKNELEALKDRLARTAAEYENFRKRTAKEKEGIYTDACEDVLKEMLPVLDNLERAVSVDGTVEDLKKGVEMTMKQFTSALEKLSVEEIPTDCEFDPHVHNAVMHIEDDNYGKNSVVEVFQKGYRRNDKVIRFSMVKVAN